MDLNSRELAALVWLLLFALWAARIPSVRRSVPSVLGALVRPRVSVVLALMGAYVVAAVLGLQRLGLWNLSQLKDTLVWTIVFAFLALFEVPNISKNPALLKTEIRKVISIALIVAFFVNWYVMSFWLEFLLQPILAMVVLVPLAMGTSPEYARVSSVFGAIQAVIGLSIFAFVLVNVIADLRSVASLQTLRDLALPAVLTILYVPFLYGLSLYAAYDSLFGRFRIFIPHEAVRAYARRRTVTLCHMRLSRLVGWSQHATAARWKTKDAVDASVRDFRHGAQAA
jgi:uncharacterized membrane protein